MMQHQVVTYIPHLFYLSPEHRAGNLRKHLHFHPATASQTAQTTCRRAKTAHYRRKRSTQPQQALWKLSNVWMLLPMCAAQVPKYTCTSTQVNRTCYHHLGWFWAGFVLLPVFSLLGTFPFTPLRATFNFASPQSTLSCFSLPSTCQRA